MFVFEQDFGSGCISCWPLLTFLQCNINNIVTTVILKNKNVIMCPEQMVNDSF